MVATAVSRRRGARVRRDAYEGGPGTPTIELPIQVSGVNAWFDSLTPRHMSPSPETGIQTWTSRQGALGAISYSQPTPSLQPIYQPSVAEFGGRPAVYFDGSGRNFTAPAAAWTFMHSGLGASRFTVWRIDPTGYANQRPGSNIAGQADIGLLHQFQTSALVMIIANGTGAYVSSWTLANAAHYARNVTRWQMWGYAAGTQHSRVSGSSLSFPDGGGPPSQTASARAWLVGAGYSSTTPLKAWIGQDLYFDHVLSAGETQSLADLFAPIYGIAA